MLPHSTKPWPNDASHQTAYREQLLGDEGTGSFEERDWLEHLIAKKKKTGERNWKEEDHPGCNIVGSLFLDRAPGNFHIQARSQNQEFDASMTNTSHYITSLFVGDPVAQYILKGNKDKRGKNVPIEVRNRVNPMADTAFVTGGLHQSYHHYIKLIPTHVDGFETLRHNLVVYQMQENSQLAYYAKDSVPEAKFIYDFSPIQVAYRRESRHWYDYCTSLMAIIGGVFTVVGMIEAGLQATVTRAQQRRRSSQYRR